MATCFMGILGVATGCLGIAFWVTGLVWRFNSMGKFGSGDIAPAGVEATAWKEILN